MRGLMLRRQNLLQMKQKSQLKSLASEKAARDRRTSRSSDENGQEHLDGLAAAVAAVELPEATDAMREATIEVVWKVQQESSSRISSPSPATCQHSWPWSWQI